MPTAHDPIRAAAEAFVADISALIRQAAVDAVRGALGGAPAVVPAKKAAPTSKAAPAKAAPAPKIPAKPAAKATPVWSKARHPSPAAKKAAKKAQRAPGEKRPPAEVAALVEKLAGHVKGNPGQGAEAIGKALGLSNSELTLPIKKLLAAKRVRSEGQKRATRYFPA